MQVFDDVSRLEVGANRRVIIDPSADGAITFVNPSASGGLLQPAQIGTVTSAGEEDLFVNSAFTRPALSLPRAYATFVEGVVPAPNDESVARLHAVRENADLTTQVAEVQVQSGAGVGVGTLLQLRTAFAPNTINDEVFLKMTRDSILGQRRQNGTLEPQGLVPLLFPTGSYSALDVAYCQVGAPTLTTDAASNLAIVFGATFPTAALVILCTIGNTNNAAFGNLFVTGLTTAGATVAVRNGAGAAPGAGVQHTINYLAFGR